ncbi:MULTISPECIES: putative zinc ribbon protein [Brenneria]|nr:MULTISPECIES: putative zinc ribbon protein [Brenneria]
MEFKKIYFAEDKQGKSLSIDLLPIRTAAHFYCKSCHNPLLTCTTHDRGRFFEHDLDRSDIESLMQCEYYISPELSKIPTIINPNIQQDTCMLGFPQTKDYLCLSCHHQYHGEKACPFCKCSIHTVGIEKCDMYTEYDDLDTTELESSGDNIDE